MLLDFGCCAPVPGRDDFVGKAARVLLGVGRRRLDIGRRLVGDAVNESSSTSNTSIPFGSPCCPL